LILAAAACAEDRNAEPPRELELMWECREFPGVLYEAGGLASQPAGLVRRMRTAYNVYQAVGAWRAAKNKAEWCESNPEEWKIVQRVIVLREAESKTGGQPSRPFGETGPTSVISGG
jgi:hypothetical protein